MPRGVTAMLAAVLASHGRDAVVNAQSCVRRSGFVGAMKRSTVSMVAGVVLSLGAAGTAAADVCETAGTLTEVVGSVMVDKGQGFAPGAVGMSLKGGDKVSVQGPGSAVVDFGSQRTVTVPGSTTETLRVPGCGLVIDSTTGAIVGVVAVGGGIAAAIALSDSSSSSIPFFPVSP